MSWTPAQLQRWIRALEARARRLAAARPRRKKPKARRPRPILSPAHRKVVDHFAGESLAQAEAPSPLAQIIAAAPAEPAKLILPYVRRTRPPLAADPAPVPPCPHCGGPTLGLLDDTRWCRACGGPAKVRANAPGHEI